MLRRSSGRSLVCVLLLTQGAVWLQAQSSESPLDRQLLMAAGKGDVAAVADLLTKGANVNATNRYGTSALFIAADRANLELVKLLLDRGAEPNATELQWGKAPLGIVSVPSSDNKAPEARAAIVTLLVTKGAGADGQPLVDLIRAGHVDAARAIINGGGVKSPSYLNNALAAAKQRSQADLVELLVKKGATDPGPADSPRSRERLKTLTGEYRSQGGTVLKLSVDEQEEEQLLMQRSGGSAIALFPVGLTTLKSMDLKLVVTFDVHPVPPSVLKVRDGESAEVFTRAGGKE